MQHLNCSGDVITNGARFWSTREIKSRIIMAKAAFNKLKSLFVSTLNLNLEKEPVKCYIWSIALCGAETWTLGKVDKTYQESFEM